METPFSEAVLALKRAQPEELVRQLVAVFENVATMTAPQVIAAWQTLDFLATPLEPTSAEAGAIRKFQEAAIARMVALHGARGQGAGLISDQDVLKHTFLSVIGETHSNKFKNRLEL